MTDRIRITKPLHSRRWHIWWTDSEGVYRMSPAPSFTDAIRRADRIIKRRRRAA